MSLLSFLSRQFISVIEWNEPQDGILAYRYPMQGLEIENGGQLTVSESQVAAFVNEGRIADIFTPGLHTLATRNLPILTDLMNWDKDFESPFKSEVYFFSTRLQIDQKWGTATPITIRDKEFGAVRLRCFGIYSYRIADPKVFFNQVSGTRECYFASDLDGQLRDSILAHTTGIFANSSLPFLDLTANQQELAAKIVEQMKPAFAALGLELKQLRRRKCLAARGTGQGARPAHRHDHGRRHQPLHPIRRRRIPRPRRRQHRRRSRRRHGPRRRSSRSAGSCCHAQSPRRRAGSSSRRRSRRARNRHQVLHRLRQTHPRPLKVLRGVRP